MTHIYKFLLLVVLCLGFAFAFASEPYVKIQADDSAKDPEDKDSEESEPVEDDEPEITSKVRNAINKGLAYLASNQNSDGSYSGNFDIATSGLAGLAFIAGGHLPNRGEYGENVAKIVRHLTKIQKRDTGYFQHPNDSCNIHGHGYAGLFLAQILGMLTDKDMHDTVMRAVYNAIKLTENSQTRDGGWGYVPDDKTFDEGSTTITQIQFLRAARDAGMNVRKTKINNAIRYVYKCAMQTDYKGLDGKEHLGYTFKYSLMLNYDRTSYPLTAAAASVLQGSGIYEGEILEGALGWMRNYFNTFTQDANSYYMTWFYYAQFYAAQAFWQSAKPQDWKNYYRKISNILVSTQNSDGSWDSGYGNPYATAISTMILAIPDRFLPLFQK